MPIERIIAGRDHDIGGLIVRRMLPHAMLRSVGPFVFLDHMGPATLAPGEGIDVRPHPHIGLATVTWLFEGAIRHRDSLASDQIIRPGDVNWMTAGRGIVHSERTPAAERAAGHQLHGIQTWVALPKADEECSPAFEHWTAETLPKFRRGAVSVRLIAGAGFGEHSPVRVFTPTLYCELDFPPGSQLVIATEHDEQALYAASGELTVDGEALPERHLALLRPGGDTVVEAAGPALAILLGGAALDGPRHLHWNFVSSRRERIEQARSDWSAQRMGAVPGETEWIPLP